MTDKEAVVAKLKEVKDPEIRMDVWTLGLIYDIRIEGAAVSIKMTFTTPFCPYGPALVDDIKNKVRTAEGVEDVNVEVVFDPPWSPPDEVKIMFGIGGR